MPHLDGLERRVAHLERQAGPDLALEMAAAYHAALDGPRPDRYLLLLYAEHLLASGDMDAALEQMRLLQDCAPYSSVARRMAGRVLAAAGKPDEALEAFEEACALYPGDYETYVVWARLLQDMGDTAKALDLFEKALHLVPDDGPALQGKAGALLDMGETRQAMAVYREATWIDPGDPGLYEALDRVLEKRQDAAGRIAAWREVVAWDTQRVQALYHLGLALEAGSDDDGAFAACRDAVAAGGGSPGRHAQALSDFASRLKDRGELDKAAEACRAAISLGPANVWDHVVLGEVLAAGGDARAACQAFRDARAIDPNNDQTYANADALLAKGDAASRTAEWRGAVDRHPQSPYPYLFLGMALQDQRDFDGADEAFREALAHAPPRGDFAERLRQALDGAGGLDTAIELCETSAAGGGFELGRRFLEALSTRRELLDAPAGTANLTGATP